MNHVVKFEQTKRKLDWKGEEALRTGKKKHQSARYARRVGRENKYMGEEE